MIAYEVVVDVEPALADALSRYLRDRHIPEILATGCFAGIELQRAGPTRFRTRYLAASRPDLDRYLDEHTAHFRADFGARFTIGVAASREIWEDVQRWSGDADG